MFKPERSPQSQNLLHRLNKALIGFASTFCVLGPLGAFYFSEQTQSDYYYPLWAYNLFYASPSQVTNYAILISELGEKKFDPPRDYFEIFPVSLGRFSPSVVIDELGSALESGNEAQLTAAREKFENRALRNQPHGRYAVYKVTWVPLERYKKNEVVEKKWLTDVTFKKD